MHLPLFMRFKAFLCYSREEIALPKPMFYTPLPRTCKMVPYRLK